MKKIHTSVFSISLLLFFCLVLSNSYSQKYSNVLLKADKFYIQKNYQSAIPLYDKYLLKNPKDFYASRQAAICYDRLNNPNMAIDYWPAVMESVEASEQDNLEYAKCLLANFRREDATLVFMQLSKSSDKTIAEWGKAYMNPSRFFKDSALCKVWEVKGINTPVDEYSPAIYGNKLFFVSDLVPNGRTFEATTDKPMIKINSATKADSVTFSSASSLHSLPAQNINGGFCLSTDETLIYVSAGINSKNMGIKRDEPFCRFQLYTTLASGGGTLQPFKYNSAEYDILHPCLSKDGTKLYFASNMKGSLGGKDIFVCEWTNGFWGPPQNLGAGINTPGDELFPFIMEDGLLYFASDARPGLGGLDIFVAKPSASAKLFETALNAGSPLNTQFDDFGILLMPGGKTGYLSSNRKNNTDDDIFYFRNNKP